MTPLDLLCRSASSEILIKLLVSAGGIHNSRDLKAESANVSQLWMQSGIRNSSGTSFGISDADIFLHAGFETPDASGRESTSTSTSIGRSELPHFEHFEESNEHSVKRKGSSSANSSASRLKVLLRWPCPKEKRTEEMPIPLRQRFSKPQSSLVNNKRTLALRTIVPSPAAKKKFTAGLMHGVIQAVPHLAHSQSRMSVSPLSSSLVSSSTFEKQKGVCEDDEAIRDTACSNAAKSSSRRSRLKNAKLMNQYFCFGTQGLAVDDSSANQRHSRFFRGCVPPVS